MLRSNLNYPYPVLKEDESDYKSSVLSTEIKIGIDKIEKCYTIKAKLETDNQAINNWLENKQCIKGIFVKSSAVWFSKFFEIKDNEEIFIKSTDIYGRVDILPCILVTDKIDKFYSDDFTDEFKDIDINVNIGEIIAVGEEITFEALLENDIFKHASSIFEFVENDSKFIEYDINYDKIIIKLPKNIFDNYKNLNPQRISNRRSILNSILVNPILLSILYDIKDEPEEYQGRKWFNTIQKIIVDKNEKNKINGYINGKIENPILVLQCITVDLINTALNDFTRIIEENNGGND